MKFSYQYRTSDNVCHSGIISAADRDAAFDALKREGLKPFGLAEVPGTFNLVFGKGKRWIAIALLALALVLSVVFAFVFREPLPSHVSDRCQIYGDPSVLEEFERTGFSKVFTHPGERYLACYARPGVVVNVPKDLKPQDMMGALQSEVVISKDDPREVRELKAIVNGLKVELRTYLSDGVGTPEKYAKRLIERQERESEIYNQAVVDLRAETNEAVRAGRNTALRAMGLRTIPTGDKSF